MIQPNQWKDNVKQIIKVTLIGIDPSDQVQIKGYLRIILRLDFDIEWVSPKNPTVNLFIVNHAFSNSESVISLIQKSQAPVLFIANNNDISNIIENNTLYLKLHDVSILESWLINNVPCVYETVNVLGSASKSNNNNMQSENQQIDYTVTTDDSLLTVDKSDILTNALKMINSINDTSSSSFYQISDKNDIAIAVFDPKRRLVWPTGDNLYHDFSLNSRIKKVVARGDLSVARALNLNCWIWTCGLAENSNLKTILPLDAKLTVRTWPKPINDPDKSDYLRILAMLELKNLSTNEIAKMTNMSIDKIHRCMAALYMAGYTSTGLMNLDVYITRQLDAKNDTQIDLATDTIQMAGNDNTTISPPVEVVQEQAIVENIPKPKEKKFSGILSRIRSTLGLK